MLHFYYNLKTLITPPIPIFLFLFLTNVRRIRNVCFRSARYRYVTYTPSGALSCKKRSKLEEGAPHRIEWREYIRLNLICMHTMAGAPVRARFGGVGWVARMWWLHWTRRSSLRPRRCLGRDSMYSHMCGCRIKRQRWLSQKCEQQQNPESRAVVGRKERRRRRSDDDDDDWRHWRLLFCCLLLRCTGRN